MQLMQEVCRLEVLMFHGSPSIPFSELFADTLQAFGVVGAWECYCKRMSRAEFRFWVRSTLGI